MKDVATELTHHLATILKSCKRIEPAVKSYLAETDEKPKIDSELLAILSNALAAYELVEPDRLSGEFHGLPREACAGDEPGLVIRHKERPVDWDFQPWLCEKLNSMQKAAKQFVGYWLIDIGGVVLHEDAGMSPKEWLRGGIRLNFEELRSKALVVFEEVCGDKLQVESAPE